MGISFNANGSDSWGSIIDGSSVQNVPQNEVKK